MERIGEIAGVHAHHQGVLHPSLLEEIVDFLGVIGHRGR